MLFESKFIKLSIIKGTEVVRQPSQRADQLKLRADEIDDQTESRAPSKSESIFGLRLHFVEAIPHNKEVRDQLLAAISGKGKVAHPISSIECTAHRVAPLARVLHIRHDK